MKPSSEKEAFEYFHRKGWLDKSGLNRYISHLKGEIKDFQERLRKQMFTGNRTVKQVEEEKKERESLANPKDKED